jgi:hypothetical protein
MIRNADAATLAVELTLLRGITLALFEAFEAAQVLDVPRGEEFNWGILVGFSNGGLGEISSASSGRRVIQRTSDWPARICKLPAMATIGTTAQQ